MSLSPPQTTVRTSHGVTIQTEKGEVIGFVTSFTPGMSRTVTPVYELNASTSGLPIENVPGNVTGLTLAINRYDIYPKRMEQAFGTDDFDMLTDQNRPFLLREVTRIPRGGDGNFTEEVRQYTGCWFTTIGRGYRSDGDRIIMVSANLAYLRKEKIQA